MLYTALLLSAEALFAFFLLYKSGVLDNTRRMLISALLLSAAFMLRAACFPYETLDYRNFLTVWVDYFRQHGGFAALKYPVGNYNIPYLYFLALFSYSGIRDLYLIKLLSVFFDVVLAYAAMQLLSKCTDSIPRRLFCFFTVLFLPTVVLNGALWGQCDSSYTALAVLGIYLALDDRPVAAMISMALSFGFKLQAVFVMPVFAALWMNGKFKLKHFLVFPAAYIVLILPAVLLGRPFMDTLTLYFSQTGSIGSGMNYSSPSVFAILTEVRDEARASTAAIMAAAVYMTALLVFAWFRRDRLDSRAVVALSLLFAVGIPFLLPHMHERYFFAADVLSTVMGFAAPELIPLAACVQFASLLGYHAYLKMRYFLPMRYGAYALIVVLVAVFVFFTMKNDEQKIH